MDYETVEEAEVLMEELEEKKDKARSPEYKAPVSMSPTRERVPVLNAYYTQNFRPKQVYGPRPDPQVTLVPLQSEGRGRRTRYSRIR